MYLFGFRFCYEYGGDEHLFSRYLSSPTQQESSIAVDLLDLIKGRFNDRVVPGYRVLDRPAHPVSRGIGEVMIKTEIESIWGAYKPSRILATAYGMCLPWVMRGDPAARVSCDFPSSSGIGFRIES